MENTRCSPSLPLPVNEFGQHKSKKWRKGKEKRVRGKWEKKNEDEQEKEKHQPLLGAETTFHIEMKHIQRENNDLEVAGVWYARREM